MTIDYIPTRQEVISTMSVFCPECHHRLVNGFPCPCQPARGPVPSSLQANPSTYDNAERFANRRSTRVLATVCVAVTLVVGLMLTLAVTGGDRTTPSASPTEPNFPAATTDPSTMNTTLNLATSLLEEPSDMVTVLGPLGLRTVIPRGWPTKILPEPGSMQATDPGNENRILKFGGGELKTSSDIYSFHVEYARSISRRPGYAQLGLRRTTVRAHEAVEWEFEWNAPEGHRHVRAVYWRVAAIEYFLYAHGPSTTWAEQEDIIDAMLTDSSP